jgi:prolyl-tRNA synthetase
VTQGKKSKAEQFAGAHYTTTVEAFIPETGKGIQGATSHCLGQNFSKMFGIEFETEDNKKAHAWQNSWGCTTRTIGVMVMTHGDDKGLVLPPRAAPKQLVVITVPNSKLAPELLKAMNDKAAELHKCLEGAGVRVASDTRDNYTPGWKYNHWELKGIPIRLELGPKDMDSGKVVLARRDTGAKETVAWGDVVARVPVLLETIQADMYAAARAKYDACMKRVTTWEAFMAAIDDKNMCLAPWADEVDIENDVKKRSATGDFAGAKTLCIPFEQPELPEGTLCFASGKPAKNWALWGRSY